MIMEPKSAAKEHKIRLKKKKIPQHDPYGGPYSSILKLEFWEFFIFIYVNNQRVCEQTYVCV